MSLTMKGEDFKKKLLDQINIENIDHNSEPNSAQPVINRVKDDLLSEKSQNRMMPSIVRKTPSGQPSIGVNSGKSTPKMMSGPLLSKGIMPQNLGQKD